MSNTKIKRGKKPAPRKPVRRKSGPKRKSVFAMAADLLPFKAETLQRAFGYGVVAMGVTALVIAAFWIGAPQWAGTQLAEITGRAGFRVEKIDLRGADRVERLAVYGIATDQNDRAMALVDLDRVRARLINEIPWIKDARVSRRLPDTLLIDITERKPGAIWQSRQQLTLVDETGVALEPVDPNAMPDLPLVIGPNANRQISGFRALMQAVPALEKQVVGASWVGNRRWDLRFQSGETLALPEGESEARSALLKFARIDGTERLLGRGLVRFDMRIPGKFVVRIPPRGSVKDDSGAEGAASGQADAGKPDTGRTGAAKDRGGENADGAA